MTEDLRALFLLDPQVVFLNHGSFGACPRPVLDVYQAWQRELERQPVEFLGTSRRFKTLLREARERLAAYVAADPDDLVYVTNATVGVNIVARSVPLQPGDEVLTTDHEYGAIDHTWQFVCGRRGARYVRAPLPVPLQRPQEVVDALWAHVTPRTRVLAISHVTSPTALILPVADVVGRARERGILTVIDGAHAPGQIPLDLTTLGADFYAANCHKWLCAPKGSGFLHAQRAAQSLLQPLVVSWGWRKGFLEELEWQGTRDPAAFLATPAAIDFISAPRWKDVPAVCHGLAREARTRVLALSGLPPLAPDGPEWYAQMVSIPLPVADGERFQRRLYDEARIEVPLASWNGRWLLRVSVQGYNTPRDIETLVAAVARLLPEERAAAPADAASRPRPR